MKVPRTDLHRLFFLATLLCLYSLPLSGQNTATQNSNRKTITKYFERVINTHNPDGLKEFFSPDYSWHTMDGKDVRSSRDSGHIATLRWLFSAIPDVVYRIDHIVAEGDLVAVNTSASSTARSEMFGLPAAQKKITYQQMFFYRLKKGRITELWEAVDTGGIKDRLAAD